MKMEYSFASITGPVREENQDSVFVKQIGENFFSLVCDGMGGHWGGAKASSISVSVFKEVVESQYLDYLTTNPILEDEIYTLTLVKTTIHQIIQKMKSYAAGDPQKSDMGTTFSLLILNYSQKKGMVVNIGDSRCYQINTDLELLQLLPDQNVFSYFAKLNYTLDQMQQSNTNLRALTSSLGVRKNIKVDYRFFALKDTSYMFQATDGLYDFINHNELERVLRTTRSVKEKLEGVLQVALRNQSNDNLTGVLIRL